MKTLKLSLIISALFIVQTHSAAADLHSAASKLDALTTKSIEFSGSGQWFQFGQAPHPQLAWPQFDVSSYRASINYESAAAHVQIVRKQSVEAGRDRPIAGEQRPDQYLAGGYAWNLSTPANSNAAVASPQPNTV
ncbi:MAG: hypothetical protein K2Q15_14240, partial [Burkholderiales bacterium]|nr:hypothetical protein [Burkholderiales bacterium]